MAGSSSLSCRAVACCCVFVVAAMVAAAMAQNSAQDFVDPHNAARAEVGVGPVRWDDTAAAYARGYARGAAARRMQAAALGLRREVRREHLLGRRRRRLDGGERGGGVGEGEAVVRPRQQQLLGAGGELVRALHAGGVARLDGDRLRPRRVRQQPRRVHHLQLLAAGQLQRQTALLIN